MVVPTITGNLAALGMKRLRTVDKPTAMTEDAQLDALWQRYRQGDRGAYEALVEAYLPLVKSTVGRMALTIPSFISREELYSSGCVGLLAAMERYDPSREARFTTYAITRIRGAVLDDLRSRDEVGRVTRGRLTRIQEAENELKNRGDDLAPEKVAEEAGLTLDEYWDAELGEISAKRVSLSETTDEGGRTLGEMLQSRRQEKPGERLEMQEIVDRVQNLLTEKERLLVVLYYSEGLTLKEIGVILGVTESRVCQLHTAMATRVRKDLEKIGISL